MMTAAPLPVTLHQIVHRLRADVARAPDASVVIPVNANGDLEAVKYVIRQLGRYSGTYTFEIVLVVNNYDPAHPPGEIETWPSSGLRIVGVPSVRKSGESVCLTARVPGARAAATQNLIMLDADVRVRNPTRLLDWYVEQFRAGAAVAYTRVGHFDLQRRPSVFFRVLVHHTSRYFKRVVMGVPTTRGSNFGVNRNAFLRAYDAQLLMAELNVGPTIKKSGGRVVYSGARELTVLTSGRKIRPGWLRALRYFVRRVRYSASALPVRHATERSQWAHEYQRRDKP